MLRFTPMETSPLYSYHLKTIYIDHIYKGAKSDPLLLRCCEIESEAELEEQ